MFVLLCVGVSLEVLADNVVMILRSSSSVVKSVEENVCLLPQQLYIPCTSTTVSDDWLSVATKIKTGARHKNELKSGAFCSSLLCFYTTKHLLYQCIQRQREREAAALLLRSALRLS